MVHAKERFGGVIGIVYGSWRRSSATTTDSLEPQGLDSQPPVECPRLGSIRPCHLIPGPSLLEGFGSCLKDAHECGDSLFGGWGTGGILGESFSQTIEGTFAHEVLWK